MKDLESDQVRQKRLFSFIYPKTVPHVPYEHERKPYPKLTSWSNSGFFWIYKLVAVGYSRTLKSQDLFYLPHDLTVERYHDIFTSHLEKMAAKSREDHQKHSSHEPFSISVTIFLKAMFFTFKIHFMILIVFSLIFDLGSALLPLVTRPLINFVALKATDPTTPIGRGIGLAVGASLVGLVTFLGANLYMYYLYIVGVQVTSILSKMILSKAFLANDQARYQFPPGKINSLVGSDLAKISRAATAMIRLCFTPLALIAGIIILAINLRVASAVAIGSFIFAAVVIFYLAIVMMNYRKKSLKYTDSRVNYIKEIVGNLKFLKLYSWEKPYLEIVKKARKDETEKLVKKEVLVNLLYSVTIAFPNFASLLTFITLFSISERTSAAVVFSSVQVVQQLSSVVNEVPYLLSRVLDGAVSLKRVSKFLSSEDESIDENVRFHDLDENSALSIEAGLFIWKSFQSDDEDLEILTEELEKLSKEEQKKVLRAQKMKIEEKKKEKKKLSEKSKESIAEVPNYPQYEVAFQIDNVNIDIKRGQMVMIVGSIGTGKSSLLKAMAGQMQRINGTVDIYGSHVLCGEPWIQSTTFKENIIFGNEYDEEFYQKVLYSTALDIDIQESAAGDLTEIGEKGVTLSGGQKARLNLARAVYADKDIYFLDDVLSAVDAQVSSHILKNCFQEALWNKTKILVTHKLELLKHADSVIFVDKDGSICQDTFTGLLNNDSFKAWYVHKEEEKVSDSQLLPVEKNKIQVTKSPKKDDVIVTNGKLVEDEVSKENAVDNKVYFSLMNLGSEPIPGLFAIMFIGVLLSVSVFLELFTSVWLSFWTEDRFDNADGFYIGIYSMITFSSVLFTLLVFTILVTILIRSSRKINIYAIKSILAVPMSYLDETPTGRIMNRFTKDTDATDTDLVENARMLLYILSLTIGIFVMNIIYLPWLAIAVPIILFITVTCGSFYQASARELKRLESTSRSHVFTNISESLQGIDIIKNYESEERFLKRNDVFLNKTMEASFLVNAIQRWATLLLNGVCVLYVFVVASLCVLGQFNISPASAGVVLAFVFPIPSMLASIVQYFALVENDMTSYERIHEYAYEIPQEPQISNQASSQWPEKGDITFENVSMRYRKGYPKVLLNLDIKIKPNENIGICGRTGAGKSTIISTLFRLVALEEGIVKIDGVDISSINLSQLRSKISIIPQESVLFEGTIRKNLDPFGKVDEEILWNCLMRIGLITPQELPMVKTRDPSYHKFHLDSVVEIDGKNFSSGEKQMISFARALVRDNKILVLDEATSSVDHQTDTKIQETIRREFKNCTILCVAHRLETIVNYDKILVLNRGKVEEFGTPKQLFDNHSTFRMLCDESKIKI